MQTTSGLMVDRKNGPSLPRPDPGLTTRGAMVNWKNLPSLLDMVKSCGKEKDLLKLRRMHADMKPWILEEIQVSNALIRAYGRCGAGGLLEAQQLFDHLPCRTIVSWNALLAGYVDNGFHAEALECFRRMEEDPGLISPSAVTYGSVLKACDHIGSLEVWRKNPCQGKGSRIIEP